MIFAKHFILNEKYTETKPRLDSFITMVESHYLMDGYNQKNNTDLQNISIYLRYNIFFNCNVFLVLYFHQMRMLIGMHKCFDNTYIRNRLSVTSLFCTPFICNSFSFSSFSLHLILFFSLFTTCIKCKNFLCKCFYIHYLGFCVCMNYLK